MEPTDAANRDVKSGKLALSGVVLVLGIIIAMLNFDTGLDLTAVDEGPAVRFLKLNSELESLKPVLMIPGIVSTGLEVWAGQPCSQKYFRQRFWGTAVMLQYGKLLYSN